MINKDDLNSLTDFWHRETRQINDNVDETMKSAQYHAYSLGYRRGRESLIIIRQQRDDLLSVVKTAYEVVTNHDESLPFDWAVFSEMLWRAIEDCKK